MSVQLALGPRERKSPYYDATMRAGATHFTVYNHMYMPVSYGDPIAEYKRLIEGAAMWDVAAERQIEILGNDSERLMRYLTPRDLNNCVVGRGKYVPLCDHDGRLINDPVLLRLSENKFWLSIADSDILLWVRAIASEGGFDVKVSEPDVSPLAVQGPKAERVIAELLGDWIHELKYFWFREADLNGIPLIVARSGWSKQGGFELYLRDGTKGSELWKMVEDAGKSYEIGPGAPNYIERVESGLLSYGADTLPDSNPFEVGLENMIALDREDDFIGKDALHRIKADGVRRALIGVKFDGAAVPPNEHPWPVFANGKSIGTLRAACYSPRRMENIGIVLIDVEHSSIGSGIEIDSGKTIFKGEIIPQPMVLPGAPTQNTSIK
jgi:glycine cleavage system aminomethyltransferase T